MQYILHQYYAAGTLVFSNNEQYSVQRSAASKTKFCNITGFRVWLLQVTTSSVLLRRIDRDHRVCLQWKHCHPHQLQNLLQWIFPLLSQLYKHPIHSDSSSKEGWLQRLQVRLISCVRENILCYREQSLTLNRCATNHMEINILCCNIIIA